MTKIIEKIVLTGFGIVVLGTALAPAVMACVLNWRFILLYPAVSVLIFSASAVFGKKQQ